MPYQLNAEHGTICALPDQRFGYFGWPTVARMEDGTLVAVASGLRAGHVCPYGRTTFFRSRDDGATWTAPRVITDLPLDDRDAGITALGGQGLLVTWFTSDTRAYFTPALDPDVRALWEPGMIGQTDDAVARWLGSWVRLSADGGDLWSDPIRVPVTAPHGPIRLCDGGLLYFGKEYGRTFAEFSSGSGRIMAIRSDDGGHTWRDLGAVPIYPGTDDVNYHEPHVVELPSGKLIGAIRVEEYGGSEALTRAGVTPFSIMTTASLDGGQTWTPATPLNFHGSPPHLLRHSSGVLVMSYGYRREPYGERVALSYDKGTTWQPDYILHDHGPDGDLGYPASVELADGGILTVYYQKPGRREDKCALLYSKWRLP